jgi:hypothetical protein
MPDFPFMGCGGLDKYSSADRAYKTLRVTPAMEAGIANHAWSVAGPVPVFSFEKKPKAEMNYLSTSCSAQMLPDVSLMERTRRSWESDRDCQLMSSATISFGFANEVTWKG